MERERRARAGRVGEIFFGEGGGGREAGGMERERRFFGGGRAFFFGGEGVCVPHPPHPSLKVPLHAVVWAGVWGHAGGGG